MNVRSFMGANGIVVVNNRDEAYRLLSALIESGLANTRRKPIFIKENEFPVYFHVGKFEQLSYSTVRAMGYGNIVGCEDFLQALKNMPRFVSLANEQQYNEIFGIFCGKEKRCPQKFSNDFRYFSLVDGNLYPKSADVTSDNTISYGDFITEYGRSRKTINTTEMLSVINNIQSNLEKLKELLQNTNI